MCSVARERSACLCATKRECARARDIDTAPQGAKAHTTLGEYKHQNAPFSTARSIHTHTEKETLSIHKKIVGAATAERHKNTHDTELKEIYIYIPICIRKKERIAVSHALACAVYFLALLPDSAAPRRAGYKAFCSRHLVRGGGGVINNIIGHFYSSCVCVCTRLYPSLGHSVYGVQHTYSIYIYIPRCRRGAHQAVPLNPTFPVGGHILSVRWCIYIYTYIHIPLYISYFYTSGCICVYIKDKRRAATTRMIALLRARAQHKYLIMLLPHQHL